MIGKVTIQTGARLHFGLLAHRPQTGRHFGGVGLMIDSPGVHLTAVPSRHDEVQASPAIKERVEQIVEGYQLRASQRDAVTPCRIEVHRTIPAHQGLGSGTQLALAVGHALEILASDVDIDLEISSLQLADRVGRGKRSALGIYGFSVGGFLVDGGKKHLEEIGVFVAQHDFPEEWRMVLVTPAHEAGLSGVEERAAFEQLSGMPEMMTNRLCRIVLMDLLPAIVEKDFHGVSESLYEYGQQVGAYFEPVQGGRFASHQMEQLARRLRSEGHIGVGQSSWGPTMFVLEESQEAAEHLVYELRGDPMWSDCTFQITAAMNQGAKITIESG